MSQQTQRNKGSTPGLLSMPLEVILQITSHLTTTELGKFRCVSKKVEVTLLPSFTLEFFTKRQFMFTEFSLQALTDISKSRLAPCLKHVIFSLQRPPRAYLSPHPNRDSAKSNCLVDESVSHLALVNTGQDVEMLIVIFKNLSNLETIGIRDFNSRSRLRDYPNVEWRSYGARTFEERTGKKLESPRRAFTSGGDATYIGRIFLNVLRALGSAQSRPASLEIMPRQLTLHDHAFYIPSYLESTIGAVLSKLRVLFLELHSDFITYQVDVNGVPTACFSYLLRKFLSKLLDLEHLRLNFRSYVADATNDVLTWLSQPVTTATLQQAVRTSLPQSPPTVDLTNLRQLDIGIAAIDSGVLFSLVRKFGSTLRTLSFHKISLLEPKTLAAEDRVNLWVNFFNRMSQLDLNIMKLKISSMNLQYLSQGPPGQEHVRNVNFMDSKARHVRRWAGPNLQSGLRDLINNISVQGLNDKDLSSDSEEDDDENVDEDEAMNDINDTDE